MAFDVTRHFLVPRHQKLGDAEAKKVLQQYHTSAAFFPKILKGDPTLAGLGAKEGDIIKIERASKTAGTSVYYRVVARE